MTKKLFKNSTIFVIGDIFNKAIPFLILPILTKYLTPSDYGIIASFSAFIGFVSIFVGLSLHGAINVAFFKLDKSALRVYIVNALLLFGITTILVLLISIIFNKEISTRLLLSKGWIYLAILVAFGQFITLVNTTLWIAEKNPKAYSIYQITQTLFYAIIILVLVVGFHYQWEGSLLATIISTIFFSFISLYLLYKREYITLEYNMKDIKDLLSFGIPMIPHQLAGWIESSFDKLLLLMLVGASATGLFTVGMQIGMIMSVIVTAFNKAWSPYFYEKLSSNPTEKEKYKIVKFTYLYFFGILLMVILLYIFSELLFRYVLDEKFIESKSFVMYILIANGFNGMYYMVVNYFFYTKQTSKLAYITFSMAILHIGLSYGLIQLYGSIGAAYSSAISMFIVFILVWVVSHKLYPMPWFGKVTI